MNIARLLVRRSSGRLKARQAGKFVPLQLQSSRSCAQLQNFVNTIRQLGSSVAILSSAFHIREHTSQLLALYRQNASELFPRRVQAAREPTLRDSTVQAKKERELPPQLIARPRVNVNLDLEHFPSQFEELANHLVVFVQCLKEFPEFIDESINASISLFEADLRYWASCLHVYKGQFRQPSIQRYVHDLSTHFGDHADQLASTLVLFLEVGVPTIRYAQKHKTDNLLNLSTVATFFSAVTATTLQFSFQLTETRTQNAVNTFWFASLVFSIGAAVNSVLGLTWKQAIYRPPRHRVPWWVLIWIKRSPLVFLVISVACFSVGLCLFAYGSNQSPVTSIITTVMTAVTTLGLAAVSGWFASERWIFSKYRGQKWLMDILLERIERTWDRPGFSHARKAWQKTSLSLRGCARLLGQWRSWIMCNDWESSLSDDGKDLEAGGLPWVAGAGEKAETSDTGRTRRKQALLSAMKTIHLQSTIIAPFITPGKKRVETTGADPGDIDSGKLVAEPVRAERSRLSLMKRKLGVLELTGDFEAHQALVRDAQFSEDGKFLITSSWDGTSIIWQTHPEHNLLSMYRVLVHPKSYVGQTVWSPDSTMLLTKHVRSVKLWTQHGVCHKTIDRQTNIRRVAWLPDGKAFLSVEENTVFRLDLLGKELDSYDFGMTTLHDAAVTTDGSRVWAVGVLSESPSKLHPSKSPVEKRLIVYNMQTKCIEYQIPILDDVRHVSISRKARLGRNGLLALISYEIQPPQLWKLYRVSDERNASASITRVRLLHTYLPRQTGVEFAGPGYFGGKDDELVLCASKGRDIHVWDRESGIYLRHIPAAGRSSDLMCMTWNPASENPFMFATGSHDGAVQLWSLSPTREVQEPSVMADG
ncbi:unnamed protein product [Mycena citricolor]|uniref:WD40 repeat-like protein n=2 Tax=Mycena citricolor TaxID=2018698 RepID=A0AAD2Q179_9AGAR|nr:unnamed protein product [Mycena citricolor]